MMVVDYPGGTVRIPSSKEVGLKRGGPGSYHTTDGRFDVWTYTEGPWKGWWMVVDAEDADHYSDPIPTFWQAKIQLAYMQGVDLRV